jgi:hypothetical protein
MDMHHRNIEHTIKAFSAADRRALFSLLLKLGEEFADGAEADKTPLPQPRRIRSTSRSTSVRARSSVPPTK